jgi:hypothetical protein
LRRSTIDLARLAELLVTRLNAALPDGVVARQGTDDDIMLRMEALEGPPPGFPTPPVYDLTDGVLVLHVPPPPARRVIALTYNHDRVFTDDHIAQAVDEALMGVADEASEASADHYESESAVEGDQLRIWFGVVPARTPPGRWRDIVSELSPIPLDEISG